MVYKTGGFSFKINGPWVTSLVFIIRHGFLFVEVV